MAFKAELPPDVKLPEGHRIDTSDERYRQLEALATAHKWSQAAFSETLAIEARRVSAEHERARAAAPAPAPAASGVPANWDKLSTREQMHHALATGRRSR
jgi:hypothetical protein